jgi:predicted aspartyl protease
MQDDMGTFRIDVAISNPAEPGQRIEVRDVLVDTGAELSCFPATILHRLGIVPGKKVRFRQATGSTFERWTGSGIVHVEGTYATDDLVFGEPSDLVLLGARSLEGLNLRIDPISKQLVDAGPMPMAAAR